MSPTLEYRIRRLIGKNILVATNRQRHFSFLVSKNKVISWGVNQAFKTNPLAHTYRHRFADIHAELAAILDFPYLVKDLKDFTMVNVRVRRIDGRFGFAYPCSSCLDLLNAFKIRNVVYSDRNGHWSSLSL